ncbi:MAG TPA: heme-binding protein [Rhodopila sp.]
MKEPIHPAATLTTAEEPQFTTAASLPRGFRFGAVSSLAIPRPIGAPPGLGPLAAFSGNWTGTGFNTIFRPDSTQTPTPLPIPVTGTDNILELNLTSETLSFSPALGSVPNRGMVQGDVFLNGVPYLQSINDVTIAGETVGIHLEPGLWVIVPSTSDPAEGQTLVRMASIPHGTTVLAQGRSRTFNGPPTIPSVDITPFSTLGGGKIPFPSQTAANTETARIPQDLTSFINAGSITQAMLTDPNTVLRNHISGQTITSTTEISISSNPASPLFGGGTENIAFLLGNAGATAPNAQTLQMTATFWIETVEHVLHIPIFKPGQPPLTIEAAGQRVQGLAAAKFHVEPPIEITTPRSIKVHSTQIQYTQEVMLNFNTLTWPHVSVATLTPAHVLPVPPTAWN